VLTRYQKLEDCPIGCDVVAQEQTGLAHLCVLDRVLPFQIAKQAVEKGKPEKDHANEACSNNVVPPLACDLYVHAA
jgi:hypothetical protein